MLQLERVFEDIFSDVKIINDRILNCGDYHLLGLIKYNDNHQFDLIIPKTKSAIDALRTKSESKTETKIDRTSSTITVVEYKSKFIEIVHQAEHLVLTKYFKGTSVYNDFFQLGLTTYTQPLRPKISEYIDHFINRFTDHPELGTDVSDAFTALKASFNPARGAQMQNKTDVGEIIEETSVERENLNLQLYINLHTLALAYPFQPEKVKLFFDTSLLFPHTYGGESKIGEIHRFQAEEGEIINTRLRGITDKAIGVVNLKKAKVAIFTASSLKEPKVPAQALILSNEGEEKLVNIDTLGTDPNNKYLLIANLDTEPAEIDVELQGKVK